MLYTQFFGFTFRVYGLYSTGYLAPVTAAEFGGSTVCDMLLSSDSRGQQSGHSEPGMKVLGTCCYPLMHYMTCMCHVRAPLPPPHNLGSNMFAPHKYSLGAPEPQWWIWQGGGQHDWKPLVEFMCGATSRGYAFTANWYGALRPHLQVNPSLLSCTFSFAKSCFL